MADWEKIRVGDLCNSIVPGRNKPKIFDGDIPWINTPDIVNRYILSSKHGKCVSRQELKRCGGKTVPAGAVIMTCVGDLGIVAIAKKEIVINQQLHAFICPDHIHNEYLAYALEAQKPQMYRLSSLTTIPYLNKANCENIVVLCPPHAEQKTIANILQTWDIAIEKTEALIVAKERQFGWLRSNIIKNTKNTKAQKFGDFLCESRVPDTENNLEKLLTVRLHLKGVGIREYRGTEKKGATQYFVRKAGQFIYGKQNIFRGSIGIIGQALDGYSSSQDIPAFDIAKNINADWLYWYISRPQFYENLEHFAIGSGSKRLHPKELFKMHADVPPITEQKRIAHILSTARSEIDLLKKLSEKYRMQKCDLLQKLLTGKWRIKG